MTYEATKTNIDQQSIKLNDNKSIATFQVKTTVNPVDSQTGPNQKDLGIQEIFCPGVCEFQLVVAGNFNIPSAMEAAQIFATNYINSKFNN